MSEPTNLAQMWLQYMDKIIPKDAHPIQIKESKRAFYAGAASMFELTTNMPEGPDELGMKHLSNLQNELIEYGRKIGTSE